MAFAKGKYAKIVVIPINKIKIIHSVVNPLIGIFLLSFESRMEKNSTLAVIRANGILYANPQLKR